MPINTNLNFDIKQSEIISISNKKSRYEYKFIKHQNKINNCKRCKENLYKKNEKDDKSILEAVSKLEENHKEIYEMIETWTKNEIYKYDSLAKIIEKVPNLLPENDKYEENIMNSFRNLDEKIKFKNKKEQESTNLLSKIKQYSLSIEELKKEKIKPTITYEFDIEKIDTDKLSDLPSIVCKFHKILRFHYKMYKWGIKAINLRRVLLIFKN